VEITSCLVNVARRAVGTEHAMASDHGSWMQGLDLVERSKPLGYGLLAALGEIRMCVVVNTIPRYDEAD